MASRLSFPAVNAGGPVPGPAGPENMPPSVPRVVGDGRLTLDYHVTKRLAKIAAGYIGKVLDLTPGVPNKELPYPHKLPVSQRRQLHYSVGGLTTLRPKAELRPDVFGRYPSKALVEGNHVFNNRRFIQSNQNIVHEVASVEGPLPIGACFI